MVSKYKLSDFLDLAKKKRIISWSEINSFFGEGFINTKDFDMILYKLDEEDIKVVNDFVNKDDKLIFKSYIGFDNPKLIVQREEIGEKTKLNPNNYFKEYLINAYLIMNYKIDDISKLYGISVEILQDWIFAYKNKYEVIVPHCYFSTSVSNDLLLLEKLFSNSSNFYYVDANDFFIDFCYEVPEIIRNDFIKIFKNKSKSDEEIAVLLKIYPSLVKELKNELKNNNTKDFYYKKALKKIPMWAQNPNQYNHKIIRAYFKAFHRFDEPPTKEMMKEICSNDATCYIDNFQAIYSSLKADGPNTNGKVFIDDGVYVQIWDEVEDVLLSFEHFFYKD